MLPVRPQSLESPDFQLEQSEAEHAARECDAAPASLAEAMSRGTDAAHAFIEQMQADPAFAAGVAESEAVQFVARATGAA